MNKRMIFYTIGRIIKIVALLMILPLIVTIIYREYDNILAFVAPILFMFILGSILSHKLPTKRNIYAKEGFAIVGLTWIILSVIGCLPFVFSVDKLTFIDALFETASGFTTTGSSILVDIEAISKGLLFWRCFTHFIGGMGVLVFVLALLPKTDGQDMHIFRAESTGPQVGKIVSKVKLTARILYGIYTLFTLTEIVLLLCGGLDLYHSSVTAFATAGTGGFSVLNASIAGYNSVYVEMVVAVFMLLFGVNFTLYYLIIIGTVSHALRNEELRWYLIIAIVGILATTVNSYSVYNDLGTTLRYSFFQVASIMTTTGFASTDWTGTWPLFSQMLLLVFMIIGGSAGSTSGGLKVSRVIILLKSVSRDLKHTIFPRSVRTVKLDGKTIDDKVCSEVYNYVALYAMIVFVSVLILSLDKFDMATNISAVITTINGVGPGLGNVIGAVGNFSQFSIASKLVLTFDMLAGRLEIYPILMLFSPRVWKSV